MTFYFRSQIVLWMCAGRLRASRLESASSVPHGFAGRDAGMCIRRWEREL